jgi:hypothetical protein
VAGANRLIAGVSSAALDNGVCFPREFFIIADSVIAGTPGRGCVKCDSVSTVARANRLITGVSSAALDNGVRFPREFFVIAGAFTLGQVLNFRSLAYITECYGELRPLNRATPASSKLSVPPPPLVLLGADLEVLA